jgi:hypothetical protein
MSVASKLTILLILALVGGGAVFLATWDIPAPTRQAEKTLPDSRFPR